MKKAAVFALLLSATSIMAASAQAMFCPEAFQGFHVGGNIGYGFGGAKVTQFDIFPGVTSPTVYTTENISVKGIDGGLNLGYTHRFDNFGLGLEGVFNWTDSKGRNTTLQVFPSGTISASDTNIKLNNSIQARANFSYVFNHIAPKIIFGWDNSKWTRFFSVENVLNATFNATQEKHYNGFLSGVGVDFLLNQHLIAGVEYTCIISEKRPLLVINSSINQKLTFRPQYHKFAFVVKLIY